MSKRSAKSIKSDEMKILHFLEQHAKENIDQLAKRCGFSRQKMWRIIKNLEEKKSIWGYSAITDDNAKHLKQFILLIKRNTVPFDASFKKELVFDKLDSYHPVVKVMDISLTHGEYNGIITFCAPSILDVKKLINEIDKRLE